MGQRPTTPSLTAADLAVLVEAFLLLPLVALGLRLFGFEPLRTTARPPGRPVAP